MAKFRSIKLIKTTNTFEEGWEDLRKYVPAITELFADTCTEKNVKIACLDIMNEHLPMINLKSKIENGFWNLTLQSNRLLFKTPRNISFGYMIDYTKDEENVITKKSYSWVVTINENDYTLRSLMTKCGWEVEEN